ncbi:hypothetical protein niasHT_003729 [Heterodera trifolii]|uniref:Integrator complex subunit 14 C-terminal domain-containing protein n=1 Tax=Heterodera trifolii TaxID=157864 RepID=A0ABD2LUY1_9BILA
MCSRIFVVLDFSSSIFLDYSNANTPTKVKFHRALNFVSLFVNELAESDIEIDLISFGKFPKIVKKSAKSDSDVKDSFSLDFANNGGGNLDFLCLRDLLLEHQNSLTNCEFILVLDVTHYKWIPASFVLPCPVHFVALSDTSNCASSSLLSEFSAISHSSNFQEQSAKISPLILCRDEDALPLAKKLAGLPRLVHSATIFVAPSLKINVHLTPNLHKNGIYSFEGQVIKRISAFPRPAKHSFRLLGFSKSDCLISIPSSSLCHIIKPSDEGVSFSENSDSFHLFAEVLGSENQIAILRDEQTDEEFVLKPYRDDPSKRWMLCLQLLPSATIKWQTVSQQQQSPAKVEFPEVSYKQSASTRIYWTDQHGIQSDVQRLQRLLKRTDRSEQFRQELRRIATYATALGYHNFASVFAEVIERRVGGIPEENRVTLQTAAKVLREGGFKQLMQLK